MIKDIIKKGSEILRRKCEAVTDYNSVKAVIDNLIDTIGYLKTQNKFTRGIGLAAPQIGQPLRISVAEHGGNQYIMINPEIVKTSKEKKPIREGCISFFEYRAEVPRFTYVKVRAYDRYGKGYFIEGKDDFAMLLQHEIDHLNGVLYIDHLPNGEKDLILTNNALAAKH